MAHASYASGRSWLTLGLILLAVGLQGCASFREVAAFASLSSNAAGNNAVMRDYIGAIDRRKQYEPQKFHIELDAQKLHRRAQQASLDALQQSVSDYMQVLDGLATGNIRTYDKSLKDLSSNLNKATLLSNAEKDAVSALSTLLARAATAVYREHEIKKLIRDGNKPLQDVIMATCKIVGAGMVADLQGESALVERYYDNFMFAPGNPEEPVAMALAREAKVEALGRVDNKIQRAQRYKAVLDQMAQGHQYLYDHLDTISKNEWGRQFRPYVDELRAAYREFLEVAQ